MERRAIYMSLALHGLALALMFCNFNFMREYSKPPAAVMMVDLTKVQISNKTNLPQKTVIKKQKASPVEKIAKPKNMQPIPVQPMPAPKKQQVQPLVKPIPVSEVKNSVPVETPTKKMPEKPVIEPPKKVKTQEESDLQSLLASVEKIRKQPVQQEVVESEEQVNNIQYGLEGRLDQILSISEKDFISSKLRECWNIDGGVQDLEDIIVEVKTLVNKDGTIREVEILNTQGYPAFQSVADSARRAIYICASKGKESPFYILSKKYADHYGDWKEIYLRFSPVEGVS